MSEIKVYVKCCFENRKNANIFFNALKIFETADTYDNLSEDQKISLEKSGFEEEESGLIDEYERWEIDEVILQNDVWLQFILTGGTISGYDFWEELTDRLIKNGTAKIYEMIWNSQVGETYFAVSCRTDKPLPRLSSERKKIIDEYNINDYEKVAESLTEADSGMDELNILIKLYENGEFTLTAKTETDACPFCERPVMEGLKTCNKNECMEQSVKLKI